ARHPHRGQGRGGAAQRAARDDRAGGRAPALDGAAGRPGGAAVASRPAGDDDRRGRNASGAASDLSGVPRHPLADLRSGRDGRQRTPGGVVPMTTTTTTTTTTDWRGVAVEKKDDLPDKRGI